MSGHIAFIINPNSGKRRRSGDLAELARSVFTAAGKRIDVHVTKAAGQVKELAAEAVARGCEGVVVAGGDGTINEALAPLANSGRWLGIVARGSGNGFARELGLPLDEREAVRRLVSMRSFDMDLGVANGEYFINAAGVGLDALIGHAFDRFGKKGPRGLLPYFLLAMKEYALYKPQKVRFEGAGQVADVEPLVLTFANGRQYGSEATIAPTACLDDGMLTAVTVSCVPFYKLAFYLPSLFCGNLEANDFVSFLDVKEAVLKVEGGAEYHLDGEPRPKAERLSVSCVHNAIKVLAPPDFKP